MRLFIYSILFFAFCFSTACVKRGECNKKPRTTTSLISFYIKNRLTGTDYYTSGTGTFIVPDSVKLFNSKTGSFYQLSSFALKNNLVFTGNYVQNSGVTDSLIFFFGTSVPDTLLVETGLVNGWRGDECATVKDAGIVKVSLRNQVLLQTNDDNGIFSLSK